MSSLVPMPGTISASDLGPHGLRGGGFISTARRSTKKPLVKTNR